MKRLLTFAAFLAVAFLGIAFGSHYVNAQTTAPAVVSVAGVHTSCPVSASGQMVICGAGDGLWLSINGAALVQVQTGTPTAGVTSISVNGGTAQTGAVALTIPTTATTTGTFTTTIK
jgi:hypothetical protein